AELAEHGFRFCMESLEAKLEKHKELPEDEKTGEAGRLEDSVRFYQEALGLARQAGDQAAVKQIQEGLKEVKKKRSQESNDPTEEAAQ
ncbi:hypothetical protein XENOCAPTIV_026593, partial [Xenoophorus captivus]